MTDSELNNDIDPPSEEFSELGISPSKLRTRDDVNNQQEEIDDTPPTIDYLDDMKQQQINQLKAKLAAIQTKTQGIQQQRFQLKQKLYQANILKASLVSSLNQLDYEKIQVVEKYDSCLLELNQLSNKLRKFSQISGINDIFFIWYIGPYGTINNFRLGNIPTRPVEWAEINAALGQCTLLLATIFSRAGIEYKKYGLLPLGSFSKVYKLDDRRTYYPLYTDGSFTFFPKRNFNIAIHGFLTCLYEISEHIRQHDPALCLPNPIDVNENTISDISILIGNDDELWTRALKYMLSNIKWVVAWYTKHYNNYIRGVIQKE